MLTFCHPIQRHCGQSRLGMRGAQPQNFSFQPPGLIQLFQDPGRGAILFPHDLQAVRARAEETLASLMKQRTILNVRKKKRRALYDALSDAEALAPVKDCYESGMPGMEEPFARYMDAVSALEQCGIHREQLMAEKAELYRQLADVNREIRQARKEISLCETIERNRPQMEHDIHVAEAKAKEVERDEYRRR